MTPCGAGFGKGVDTDLRRHDGRLVGAVAARRVHRKVDRISRAMPIRGQHRPTA